jgi:hypothetical protein
MSKSAQFPRLAIVGSKNKKRWQPPASAQTRDIFSLLNGSNGTEGDVASADPNRMTVMPRVRPGFNAAQFARIWHVVRSYFLSTARQPRCAAVLSFRRYGLQTRSFSRSIAEESLVPKKGSGSVGWESDQAVAPREGGRGH